MSIWILALLVTPFILLLVALGCMIHDGSLSAPKPPHCPVKSETVRSFYDDPWPDDKPTGCEDMTDEYLNDQLSYSADRGLWLSGLALAVESDRRRALQNNPS